jgi:hypothetical protein
MRRVCDLVDKNRRGISEKPSGETDKESRVGKSLFVRSAGLHADTDDQKQVTGVKSWFAAVTVGAPGCEGCTEAVAEPVNGSYPTEVCAAGEVHEFVPAFEGEHRSHET